MCDSNSSYALYVRPRNRAQKMQVGIIESGAYKDATNEILVLNSQAGPNL